MTHRKLLNKLTAGVLVLTCIMGFTFSNVASATTLPEAINAARCGIVAQVKGAAKEDLQVFANKAKLYAMHAQLIYQAGYISGVLDVQAYTLSSNSNGYTYESARIEVATELYEQLECKANVKI